MTPGQKLLKKEGTVRRIESMQQSSATPKNQDVGIGLWKIVVCSQSSSQCLLAVFAMVFILLLSLLCSKCTCSSTQWSDITRSCYTYIQMYVHAYYVRKLQEVVTCSCNQML